MFEKDYISLNSEQRQVVDSYDENILVLASAGTGKTKVMALRAAKLIAQNIEPQHILCLTFTNKAAKEMKERIKLYVPEHVNKMTIKTFHSFCYYIITNEKQNSHFSFPCTLIDETDTRDIIQRILEETKLYGEKVYPMEISTFFESVKKFSLNFPSDERYDYKFIIDKYHAGQSSGSNKNSFIRKHGYKLFVSYVDYLRQNNSIDFMDLIVEAYYLLEDEDTLKKWRNLYKVIQVDEMQDTSIREYEILKLLAGNQLSLFGDFNQTIYEWRGSNPEEMIRSYRNDFTPQEIVLKLNYRSTKILLEAANGYISNSRLYPIQCMPKATEPGEKISVIQAATRFNEIKMIRDCVIESKERTSSIAVLTRSNKDAKEIAFDFNKNGIKATIIEDTKFFRKKEIKDILSFFDYTLNDRNNYALLKISEHPYINMPNWLINEFKNSKECHMYGSDWLKSESKDPYSTLFNAHKHQDIVILDVESTGLSTTEDEIIQIAAIKYGELGCTDSLDILLKPTRSVGDSYFVHGFSDQTLQEKGIDPSEALIMLKEFVKGSVVVGHNVNYDIQIIDSMCNRHNIEPISYFYVYDTLDLACKVYPNIINHKLDTLSKMIQTNTAPTHNAMQDILATGEVLDDLIIKLKETKQGRLEKIELHGSYINEYRDKIWDIRDYIKSHSLSECIVYLMNKCLFSDFYDHAQIKSIRELYRIALVLEDTNKSYQDNIIELLAFSSLHYSEIEQSELFKDQIPVITVHQAKGLEFDEVYIAGCNEKVFPSYISVKNNNLIEEMRLFYVAITRAKKRLYLSYSGDKKKSMFIDKISSEYKQYIEDK